MDYVVDVVVAVVALANGVFVDVVLDLFVAVAGIVVVVVAVAAGVVKVVAEKK